MDQGLPYYEAFVDTFPTVDLLANAKEEEVLKLWEGLGYYSRARNLHATAKYVSLSLDNAFPSSYEGLIKLKGVGPYTAAAISSICFGEVKPVVDGNVFRFASRYFGIEDDIAKASSRKVFEKVLEKEIPSEDPGSFNQAMMEFGATTCSPYPKCEECPYSQECYARINGVQQKLPVKSKTIKVKDRHFHYLVISDSESFLMKSRDTTDVWAGLYDFPLLEGKKNSEMALSEIGEFLRVPFQCDEVSSEYKHILSHQRLFAVFYRIKVTSSRLKKLAEELETNMYSVGEIITLPRPKLIVNYLKDLGFD